MATDLHTSRQTVDFLWQRLRLAQFVLKSQVRTRKQAQCNEEATRQTIRTLIARIEREIDQNPSLFRKEAPPASEE